MLKKRILAFQAAIMLSASMMATAIAPVGNIAIVKAAETPKNEAKYSDMPGGNYSYSPGTLVYYSPGKVATNDTVKFMMLGQTEATKNYKESVSYYDDTTKKIIYGTRTINEAASYQEQPYTISKVYDVAKKDYVPAAEISKYATISADGKLHLIGNGEYRVYIVKHFAGSSTWTVVDEYENGVKDTQEVSSKDYEYYWDDEDINKIPGYEFTRTIYVNEKDETGTGYRMSDGYGEADDPEAWPSTSGISIKEITEDEIYTGDSAVLTLTPYKPYDKTHTDYYEQYNAETDTNYYLRGSHSIKENVVSTDLKWTVTGVKYYDEATDKVLAISREVVKNPDGTVKEYKYRDQDYKEVEASAAIAKIAEFGEVNNGVFVGKKACTAQVTADLSVTSNFTVRWVWEDGVTNQYLWNQGYKGGSNTNYTRPYSASKVITVIDKADAADKYNEKLRIGDPEAQITDADFGKFNAADDLFLGKGETKSIVNAWGTYKPRKDVKLDAYNTTYKYWDQNGTQHVIHGNFTVTENVVGISHEYYVQYSKGGQNVIKVDQAGNLTGVAPGQASLLDYAKVRSTFTITYEWEDGKTYTVETGERIKEIPNELDVEVVNAAKAVQNQEVITVGNADFRVSTDTKTATLKCINKKAKKSIKKYTVPVTVNVNGEKFKVTGIESEAFKDCTKLTTFSSKANITTFGYQVFSGCSKLTTVDLTYVKTERLTDGTFKKCKKLKTLTVNGNALKYVDDGTFINNKANGKLIIKCKNKSTYNSVVAAFKDAGYTKLKFKYKKLK